MQSIALTVSKSAFLTDLHWIGLVKKMEMYAVALWIVLEFLIGILLVSLVVILMKMVKVKVMAPEALIGC